MRVSTVVIILLIIGAAVWFAHKKGYIGQAQREVQQSFETHFEAGQGLYQTTKYKEAIQEFQTAIDLEPENPKAADALFRIGHCYRDSGDKAKAMETYKKVIATYPNSPNRGMVEKAMELLK